MNQESRIKNLNIIIGVTSGIAGYKILELIRLLRKDGITVFVIMTKHAVRMFGVEEFEKISEHKVYTDIIPDDFDIKYVLEKREVEHIDLSDKADLLLIAPGTANIIGKIASGIADDFLTTVVLASRAKVLVCPSMNSHMWQNKAVSDNIEKLIKRGYVILNPAKGKLACGYEGIGRLPKPELIYSQIKHIFKTQNQLKGKKIIVTAGASVEPIDAVRMITNRGSGKMGKAIADECVERGAEVLMLKSVSSNVTGAWQKEEIFESVNSLVKLIEKYISSYDVIFHTASVSDYQPSEILFGKIESTEKLNVTFKPTKKLIDYIKVWNPDITLVGFKAVYKESKKTAIVKGKKKMKECKADFIVINDVGVEGIGFGSKDNEVVIISKNGKTKKLTKSPKNIIAADILDFILNI